jgi:hypothetical protein
LAVLLRLPALLHDGLWRDDAYVYVDVTAPTFAEFLHRVTQTEWHPPLYFAVVYYWVRLFGTSEFTLMILPFLFTIATVPLVYALGKKANSPSTGLWAALMFAAGPSAVASSDEYLYPLMGLVCTMLALLVTAARREDMRPAPLIAIAVTALLAAYTNYFALFFLPLLVVWAIGSPRGWKHGLVVAAAIVVGALPFLFWLPVLLSQRAIGLSVLEPASLSGKAFFCFIVLRELMPVMPGVFAFVFLVGVATAAAMVVRREAMKLDAAALGLMFFAILCIAAVANLRISHYLLPFVALLYVSIAWIAEALIAKFRAEDATGWRTWGRLACALLALACIVGDVVYAFGTTRLPKSGIRTFVASKPLDASTYYLIAPDYAASTFAFYARGASVDYGGFVQRDAPQIFRLDGYAAKWNSPSAVQDALRSLQTDTRGYRYLCLIVDTYAENQGAMPFGKTWQLLAAIEKRYTLSSKVTYAARYEPIAVYRFLLPPSSERG